MTSPTPAVVDDQPAETPAAEQPAPAPVAVTVSGVGFLTRLWQREPVRVYLYAVAAAVLGLLVAYGVLTDSLAAIWAGVASAVLSLPVTEGVRSQVSPAGAGA